MKIAPSLLSADFSNLSRDLQEIEKLGVDYLHIDMMDGMFVSNLSFGPLVMEGIRPISNLVFDCHLMIVEPERYIDDVAAAGADIITVHIEATNHIHRVIQQIKDHGKKAGIAINPGTPVEALKSIIDMVDLVLVMSVNPGFGGQKFIGKSINKIKQLAEIREKEGYEFEIELDGGINAETGKECVKAGADVLVAGSYIFGSEDRSQAINSLKNIK